MIRTFQYRLYPTKKQTKSLQATKDACRWVYNKTLEVRKNSWEEQKKSLSYFDTNKLLMQWKKENPFLKDAFSQCLQESQKRVDLAFKAFFRRVKQGDKPGYPRFKGRDRYNSFTFPQYNFKIVDDRINLSRAGSIKMRKSRELEGKIKTLTIRRSPTGKWYAYFCCEVEKHPLSPLNDNVGIDMGLEDFTTLSTGEKIPNP